MADQGLYIPAEDDETLEATMITERSEAAISFLEDFAGVQPQPQEPARDETIATRAVKDIGGGIVEAPMQVVGGVLDAFEGALSGVASFDQWASEKLGLPKLQLFDREGNLDIRLMSAAEAGEADVMLPEVGPPDTVTGGLVRGISQFLTGFAGGARLIGNLQGATTMATALRGSAAAAISDFAAFDGHEARLSDLIQSVPALQNPITAYLASDMDDGELEGRLKNVLEGGLSDAAIAGIVTAVRSIRHARAVKAGVGGETYAEAARRMGMDPTVGMFSPANVEAVRRVDAPAVSMVGGADDVAALAEYVAEGGRSADDVAQRALDEIAAPSMAGSTVRAGDGEVFINWSRMDTAEDVKGAIQNMADLARDEIERARRGVRPNEVTELSADQLNAWELLAERRTGQPMNAEETLAMRRMWVASGEKLIEAARAVQTSPTPANVFAFRRAMALHGTVQREVIAVRTETARALQQWAIPAGSDEEMIRQIGETIDMFGGSDVAISLANKISAFADEGNLGAIDVMSRKGAFASTMDAVFEFWRASILSGPKTHMVNIASNTGVVGLLQLERLTAAAIGAARMGQDAISAREAGAMVHASIASLRDAWRFARQAWRTNRSGYGMGKVEAPYMRAISTEALGSTSNRSFNAVMNQPVIARGIEMLGAVTSVPGRSLGAADEFFKTINYRMDLHAQAVRQAVQEARDGLIRDSEIAGRAALLANDPTEAMRISAREAAQYGTFTNDPGEVIKVLSRMRNKVPFLRYVMPFLNTPANILRFTAERTPIAPLMPTVRADIMAGGARRDLALARLGLGSAAMLTAFDLAMSGHITGGGPQNHTELAALRRTGWQPYSIKINDRFFAFNRLDPIGMQLGVAAEMAEVALNSDTDPGGEWDEAVYRAIGAVAQNLTDKTYLRGIADFFEAVSDPRRFFPTYGERLAAGFVPAFGREIATAMAPEMTRSTNTLERMAERVPGLRDDLAVRHDLWGRPITYQSGLGAGYDAISPIYSSKLDPEPIDLELQALGYFPGQPTRTITRDGVAYNLKNEPEAYEEFMVLQGSTPASQLPVVMKSNGELDASSARLRSYGDATLLETLNAIVSGQHALSAEYADLTTDERGDFVRRVIRDYRTAARGLLIERHPELFGGY